MEIRYHVKGARRKELVEAISKIVDCPSTYKGAPTFAYEIGDMTVDKEGTLMVDHTVNREQVDRLVKGLSERGFEPKTSGRLTIETPLDGFTNAALENLDKLIASKASLIQKATHTKALPIIRTDTTLQFPWFPFSASADEVNAYTHFVAALCQAAKTQQRVTAKEKPVENEKFAFRVFLIRLGFVGSEYKAARAILLKPLSGNSAFKRGAAPQGKETKDA